MIASRRSTRLAADDRPAAHTHKHGKHDQALADWVEVHGEGTRRARIFVRAEGEANVSEGRDQLKNDRKE